MTKLSTARLKSWVHVPQPAAAKGILLLNSTLLEDRDHNIVGQIISLDTGKAPNHNEQTGRIWATTLMEPTVEIHVYGQDLLGLDRCRYNLESGAITPFMTRKHDNC